MKWSATQPVRMMYLLTIPQSALWYLRGQLEDMGRRGYDTSFVSTVGARGELNEVGRREGVAVYPLKISREIDPPRDLISVVHLYRLMGRIQPDIVNFGNPKTGLVGAVAAVLRRIPVRVYTLHGLRLETATGIKRRILTLAERLTMLCAHRVVAVSPSLRARALELGLTTPEKIVVLHHGSVNGIQPLESDPSHVLKLRQGLGLPETAIVFGFVGRFTRDKGIRELIDAFLRLKDILPDARLLLVGDFEDGDPVDDTTRHRIERTPEVIRAGYVEDVVPYYGLIDVLVLPTYREGFPTVALEAASMGIPLITTDATGARDAVIDGVTGLRVPLGDVDALMGAMMTLAGQPHQRAVLGQAAREWVLRDFSQDRVWESWDMLYRQLLEQASSRSRRRVSLAAPIVVLAALSSFAVRALLNTRRTRRSGNITSCRGKV